MVSHTGFYTEDNPKICILFLRQVFLLIRLQSLDTYSLLHNIVYYIDTDEISGFFLLLKNHEIFIARSEDTISWLLTQARGRFFRIFINFQVFYVEMSSISIK